MSEKIDARGLSCPQPVMMTNKKMEEIGRGAFEVLVDTETAKENITRPLKHGGTGSRSEFEEQPDFLPDRFESGTPNAVGIAGLLSGVRFVLKQGVESIRRHESQWIKKLIEGFKDIPHITLYGPEETKDRIATLSFNIQNLSPSEVASLLEEEFGILSRPGLHCAPSAHKTIGTFPKGTVRFSLSTFASDGEVKQSIEAVRHLLHQKD